MEGAANISSEQELAQLRNEGKISEAEYNDLLAAMKSPATPSDEPGEPPTDAPASKRRLGKIAFNLMLVGIALPTVVFLVSLLISAVGGLGEMDRVYALCMILCVLIEIPAFVLGVVSWPDVYGKAAVASVSAMVALALLSMLFVA